MSAEFKVIKIDPEGSGMDYDGHLGDIVVDAKRCCKKCTVIFGTIGDWKEFGPFIPGELEPLNDEAKAIMSEIDELIKLNREKRSKKRTVVMAKSFQKALADITGEVYFDAPEFEIKKGDC